MSRGGTSLEEKMHALSGLDALLRPRRSTVPRLKSEPEEALGLDMAIASPPPGSESPAPRPDDEPAASPLGHETPPQKEPLAGGSIDPGGGADTARRTSAVSRTGATHRTSADTEPGSDSAPVRSTALVRPVAPVRQIEPVRPTAPVDDCLDALDVAGSLEAFAIYMILRLTLPREGGTVRMGELQRRTNCGKSQFYAHFRALERSGLIRTVASGQEGRTIEFGTSASAVDRTSAASRTSAARKEVVCKDLDLKDLDLDLKDQDLDLNTLQDLSGRTSAVERTTPPEDPGRGGAMDRLTPWGRRRETARASAISGAVFWALLSVGRNPEDVPGNVIAELLRGDRFTPETAAGLVLDCAPRARSNLGGYLHGAIGGCWPRPRPSWRPWGRP